MTLRGAGIALNRVRREWTARSALPAARQFDVEAPDRFWSGNIIPIAMSRRSWLSVLSSQSVCLGAIWQNCERLFPRSMSYQGRFGLTDGQTEAFGASAPARVRACQRRCVKSHRRWYQYDRSGWRRRGNIRPENGFRQGDRQNNVNIVAVANKKAVRFD